MMSAHAGDIVATELIVSLWHNFNDRSRKSPIEMFEGPSALNIQNAGKIAELNFKSWLIGQAKKQPFDTSAALRAKGKRRISDGYFTFV